MFHFLLISTFDRINRRKKILHKIKVIWIPCDGLNCGSNWTGDKSVDANDAIEWKFGILLTNLLSTFFFLFDEIFCMDFTIFFSLTQVELATKVSSNHNCYQSKRSLETKCHKALLNEFIKITFMLIKAFASFWYKWINRWTPLISLEYFDSVTCLVFISKNNHLSLLQFNK